MGFLELFLVAVGLSMDAFAVAICKGLSLGKVRFRHTVIVGAYFGVFQAVMPLIGYFLGSTFSDAISRYDHWVAFVLLLLIGGNMIREALGKEEEEKEEEGNPLRVGSMLLLAFATSIDALAVGLTLAFLKVPILPAVCLIGVTTFAISMGGVKIGSIFGLKYKSKAEIVGGAILILLGTKILLEHLGVINF